MAIYNVYVVREYVVGAKTEEEAIKEAKNSLIDEVLQFRLNKTANTSEWVDNSFGFLCEANDWISLDDIEDEDENGDDK